MYLYKNQCKSLIHVKYYQSTYIFIYVYASNQLHKSTVANLSQKKKKTNQIDFS